jgi:hypothetical protein
MTTIERSTTVHDGAVTFGLMYVCRTMFLTAAARVELDFKLSTKREQGTEGRAQYIPLLPSAA